jgi:DNA repair protein RadC
METFNSEQKTVIHENLLAEVEVKYLTNVKVADRIKITQSKTIHEIFRILWDENTIEHVESCYVLLLNRSNHVLGWKRVSEGGVKGTVVDPKVVFQLAIKTNSSAIVIAHNHPSGNLHFSEIDKSMTKKLKESGKLLEIDVLDHLILTSEGYLSMADEGIITQ